jgi:hypothetical protein
MGLEGGMPRGLKLVHKTEEGKSMVFDWHGILGAEEGQGCCEVGEGAVYMEHEGMCIWVILHSQRKSLTPMNIGYFQVYPTILLFRPRNLTVSNFFITALLP